MRKTRSCFGGYITDYIKYKVENGYSESSFARLYMFDQFLADLKYENGDELTREIIDEWDRIKATESKTTQNKRISVVRCFCRYLNAIGIKAYVSTNGVKSEKKVPFVFTADEIRRLFPAIDAYFSALNSHYSYMVPVILRLLYATGMRVGEAVKLELNHIDSANGVIHVVNSKNNVSRTVYMSDDTCRMMAMYIRRITADYMNAKWLFPNIRGSGHVLACLVSEYFRNITKSMGYTNEDYHPVVHSLRHTFTVHVIDQRLKLGESLNELMPYLEKQLGHRKLESTWYYYHMVYDSYDNVVNKTRDVYPEVIISDEDTP